jgi:hypothetical protein
MLNWYKNSAPFFRTRKLILAFTLASRWILHEPVQPILHTYSIPVSSILILFSNLRLEIPRGIPTSNIQTKMFLISPVYYTVSIPA